KRALFETEMSVKLFANKDLPLVIRKKAYTVWKKHNKNWNTGLQVPDISDEMWESTGLDPFLKKLKAAMVNKDLSDVQRLETIREIESEAMGVLGIADAGKVVGPFKEQVKEQSFAAGTGMLTKDAMSDEARGLLAMSEPGRAVVKTRVAARDKSKFGIGDKPIYKPIGGTLYKIEGEKAIPVVSGSLEDKAIMFASKTKEWGWADAVERYDMAQGIKKVMQQMEADKKKKKGPLTPEPPKPEPKAEVMKSEQPEGTIIVNKATGARLISKGGQWVPWQPENQPAEDFGF
ncbi:MAG: hypothetical protein WBC22_01270, partial [Sedimentisphaerales bacterium]